MKIETISQDMFRVTLVNAEGRREVIVVAGRNRVEAGRGARFVVVGRSCDESWTPERVESVS